MQLKLSNIFATQENFFELLNRTNISFHKEVCSGTPQQILKYLLGMWKNYGKQYFLDYTQEDAAHIADVLKTDGAAEVMLAKLSPYIKYVPTTELEKNVWRFSKFDTFSFKQLQVFITDRPDFNYAVCATTYNAIVLRGTFNGMSEIGETMLYYDALYSPELLLGTPKEQFKFINNIDSAIQQLQRVWDLQLPYKLVSESYKLLASLKLLKKITKYCEQDAINVLIDGKHYFIDIHEAVNVFKTAMSKLKKKELKGSKISRQDIENILAADAPKQEMPYPDENIAPSIRTEYVNGVKLEICEVQKAHYDKLYTSRSRFFLKVDGSFIYKYAGAANFYTETGKIRWDFFCMEKQECMDLVAEYANIYERMLKMQKYIAKPNFKIPYTGKMNALIENTVQRFGKSPIDAVEPAEQNEPSFFAGVKTVADKYGYGSVDKEKVVTVLNKKGNPLFDVHKKPSKNDRYVITQPDSKDKIMTTPDVTSGIENLFVKHYYAKPV